METNQWNNNLTTPTAEEKELFKNLVQTALAGKNSEFEFIRCWHDRCSIKNYVIQMSSIINMFTKLCKTTYKTYLNQINLDLQDIQVLLALKQFKQCRDYYKQERSIALDMLDEYTEYVLRGHILDTLMGEIRPDTDLVDYRDLPITRWF